MVLRLEEFRHAETVEKSQGVRAGLLLPVIIRNVGTRTARKIILRVRYSVLLEVASNNEQREDVDRRHWIVIDHEIPDLNPQQHHKFPGDMLRPTNELLEGMLVETTTDLKDRKNVRVTMHVLMAAPVEMILYSEDAEPLFLSCKISVDRGDQPQPAQK
ncbi:MAG: hypothetical protein QM775_33145 [Pirellulales bacterium]